MLFWCSQVCGRLQQRERILRQAERVQVSQSSPNICATTRWCNLSVSREIWSMASDPCHRPGVRWFTCPSPWLPSGRSSPDNLTRWSVYSVMSRLPYDPNIDTLSLGRSEPAISHDREIQSGRSGGGRTDPNPSVSAATTGPPVPPSSPPLLGRQVF